MPATIWNIASFEQWDVELGKVLEQRTTSDLRSADESRLEGFSSTNAVIRRYRGRG